MSGSVVDHTIAYVKNMLEGAEGGHDWYHIERVWQMARFIRQEEKRGDRLTIELAALLHDVSDPKFNGGNEEEGQKVAIRFLKAEGVDRERIGQVGTIVRHLSFKGGKQLQQQRSIEFQIVQDADRLDAMGAIGIARAFNYGGYKNLPIYDPSVPLTEYPDSATYYASKAPTINHFHEKLLKLKDLMNTETGRSLAEERHQYMINFLERFHRECDQGSQ